MLHVWIKSRLAAVHCSQPEDHFQVSTHLPAAVLLQTRRERRHPRHAADRQTRGVFQRFHRADQYIQRLPAAVRPQVPPGLPRLRNRRTFSRKFAEKIRKNLFIQRHF